MQAGKPVTAAPVVTPKPREVAGPAVREEHKPLEDWVSLEELHKNIKKKDVNEQLFEKLTQFGKGELPEHAHAGLAGQLKKEEGVMDKLRNIALQGLSPADRKKIAVQLKLLKQGKLSKEEQEELFRKLKITADYYQKNRDVLEKDIESLEKGRAPQERLREFIKKRKK